ncbi:MAG: DUF2971 domain-containing protein [Verrucomicrobia bacterium]|nr:DUF2971 domain-containing protein [Verrucomicrobiota bacterium]
MRTPSGISYDDNQKIWRYMRVGRFEQLLKEKSLRFASANQFEDPFEGAVAVLPYDLPVDPRYTVKDSSETAFAELKRLTKLSCWHIADHESTAMWKLYSDLGKGVAITSTPNKLARALTPFRLKPEYGVEELWGGNVVYVDLLRTRLSVGMLERFYFKHSAYSWEQEFRLAISVRVAEEHGVSVPEDGISVGAAVSDLIEEIHIGPTIEKSVRERIITTCRESGLDDRARVTSLLGTPKYI